MAERIGKHRDLAPVVRADLTFETRAGVACLVDGGIDVVVAVTNSGTRPAGASCRVVASGMPEFRDYVFFTDQIPAGETRSFTANVPPLPSGQPLPATLTLAVRCN